MPDALLCGSEWSKQRFVAAGYPPQIILPTPYPVDTDLFSAATSTPGAAAPVFVHIGRCDPRKRLDLLVAAFREVRVQVPQAQLRIVGRPGYFPQITRLFEGQEGLEYSPHLPHEQMTAVLGESHVLVQTSQNEDFGSAVAEGLCTGLPAVVGSSNGTADYIDRRSVLFRRHEPADVAAAMLSAWREDTVDKRTERVEGARKCFAVAKVADTFEKALAAAGERYW